MKERPLIGIITAQASNPEQRQLLGGMIAQAQTLGVDIAIFSNIYNSAEYFAEVEVENRIYDLILSRKLDGLILTAEAFLNPTLQQDIYRKLIQRSDIPLIVTGAQIEGFECIDTDVRADANGLVSHLIEEHGFNEIDYLTGPKNIDTSIERVNGYKDALTGHGILFDQRRVVFGDFWYNSGWALADEYISGHRPLPQAVACANDYMAFGLCDRLMENGIRIPEDVSVIGYEFIGERNFHTPILTTFSRNRHALGEKAVIMLYNRITGSVRPLPSIAGRIITGDSCPCGADVKQLCSELGAIRREKEYNQMNLVGNFEQQLSTCRSVPDYVHVLQEFVYLVRDVLGVYMCLFDNWCSSSGSPVPETSINDPMICYTVKSPDDNNYGPIVFRPYDEFTPAFRNHSGLIMYLCPVFFSGRYFGFFILQYRNADGYDVIFRDWLKIAASGLELLRMKNDISTLLECRDLSVLHDSSTGLYNMQGMRNELHAAIKSTNATTAAAILVRTGVFSETISLNDRSRMISDDRTVADILRYLAGDSGELSGKVADNTYFVVCAGDHDKASAELLADKINTLIAHKRSGNPAELVTETEVYPVDSFDIYKVYKELYDRSNERICQLSILRRNASFAGYDDIRAKIYSSPNEDFRAEKLCRTLGHSAGYFRAMYKELFGLSFHQDLIRSRISYAKMLILTDTASFSSIASRCGYNDEKHFYHQFRQITGLSPKQYRTG